MITRRLFERVRGVLPAEGGDAMKDLNYAFFLSGASMAAAGMEGMMEAGNTLGAQRVAALIVSECTEEIHRLKQKYESMPGDITFKEFKL